MSSFCKCKSYSHFFSKNIGIYAIFNDQSFNDTLTNDIVSFEQLGPGLYCPCMHNTPFCMTQIIYKTLFACKTLLPLLFCLFQVLNVTGDQDICYYNFACAHPLGRVSSFNNIFSNCGYVMLGVLFLILVARR